MKLKTIVRQELKYILHRYILPIVYNKYRKQPLQKGKVIFADSNSDTLPESMRLVYERLSERDDLDIRLCLSDIRKLGIKGKLSFILSFMREYATAEYVFICNYFLPVTSCCKRKGTRVVQLWHSCGLLKKFAYDTPDDISPYYRGDVTKNISMITVSSPAVKTVFENAYRLEGVKRKMVRAVGVSRTDVFFDEKYQEGCRQNLFERYPEFKGKKIVLYAPTFRGTAAAPELVGEQSVISLQQKLGDDWAVIIKPHPHIRDVSSNCDIPTSELFAAADVLISDYSSLIFEYALLKKPFVLYMPDHEDYIKERGFYVSPETFPCEIVKNGDELKESVLRAYGRKPDAAYDEFLKYHMGSCDGHSTDRILKIVK
ncbi:MAG: CDP-glycerol glycerophosphotransferase family protein [Ruminococcus sp.]|nr:CDP-glycerol glycerophosphotransferase family protein [Ruminococcus sp.]